MNKTAKILISILFVFVVFQLYMDYSFRKVNGAWNANFDFVGNFIKQEMPGQYQHFINNLPKK